MFWKTVIDILEFVLKILLGILKALATGVVSLIIVIAIGVFIAWRIYKRYKRRDVIGDAATLKELGEVFKGTDSLKSLEANLGKMKFEFQKEDKPKKVEVKDPRAWPKVIQGKGKPFKNIAMFETEKGEVEQVTLLSYYVPVAINKDSILYGKKLYFMYRLVPDDFKKTNKLRVPKDGFNVEEGQILGYIGECNEFFIMMAKFLSIFNFRINVLNNKIPVLSPVKGFIGHIMIDDFESVKTTPEEYLLAIYYPVPSNTESTSK